jgi:hypothetical protein
LLQQAAKLHGHRIYYPAKGLKTAQAPRA